MVTEGNLELLQGVNIERFSRLVYSRNYPEAMKSLIRILDAVEMSGVGIQSQVDVDEIVRIQSILSAAITALICDEKLTLDPNAMSALMSLKANIRTVFATSAYGDMKHLTELVGRKEGGQIHYDTPASLGKFLLACTLDFADEVVVEFFPRLPEDQRLIFWLGCMDSRMLVDQRENRLRHQLLLQAEHLTNCMAHSVGELQLLCRVWMNCSYWSYPEKHLAKQTLSRVLMNTHESLGVKPPPKLPKRTLRSRPRMLIVCETWETGHAMFRCYQHAVSSLREKFHTVGLVMTTKQDDVANAVFDEMAMLNPTGPIHESMKYIRDLQPDMIYYPSVGMHLSIIQLASYRLAPIQLMTAGHPASSFLATMDYMVLEEDMLSDPETISETVLLTKRESFTYHRPEAEVPDRRNSEDNVVNVVISSVFFKLSPVFIARLEEIVERTDATVHFHFLAALHALNRVPFERGLKKLGRVTCYELTPYQEYLEIIAGCDLQLAPFPFGNANGFTDAMLVGLPIVCMDGAEIHSHTDAAWGRRVGLPEQCITYTEEQYVETAVKMIDDTSYRQHLTAEVAALNLDGPLFGENPDELQRENARDFANMLHWLYRHHEVVQQDSKKVWRVEDREAVS